MVFTVVFDLKIPMANIQRPIGTQSKHTTTPATSRPHSHCLSLLTEHTHSSPPAQTTTAQSSAPEPSPFKPCYKLYSGLAHTPTSTRRHAGQSNAPTPRHSTTTTKTNHEHEHPTQPPPIQPTRPTRHQPTTTTIANNLEVHRVQ